MNKKNYWNKLFIKFRRKFIKLKLLFILGLKLLLIIKIFSIFLDCFFGYFPKVFQDVVLYLYLEKILKIFEGYINYYINIYFFFFLFIYIYFFYFYLLGFEDFFEKERRLKEKKIKTDKLKNNINISKEKIINIKDIYKKKKYFFKWK